MRYTTQIEIQPTLLRFISLKMQPKVYEPVGFEAQSLPRMGNAITKYLVISVVGRPMPQHRPLSP